jgi:hypothetical protein
MAQEYSVEVQSDFLERQTKAPPVAAVAELIWNSLDADATDITVDFENDNLGGISKIVVSDNGDAFLMLKLQLCFAILVDRGKKPARIRKCARQDRSHARPKPCGDG